MKPLIGISGEFRSEGLRRLGLGAHFLLVSYTEMFRSAGGLPVVLPLASGDSCEETLARIDGLVLTGDARDVPPSILGRPAHPKARPVPEERWQSDTRWLEAARALEMPVLAICFGMQLLNVAEGGTVFQHVPDEIPDADAHITEDLRLEHEVEIEPDSLLAAMAPARRVVVRSTHHQAVDDVAPGFRVVARAGDGVIEAIERTDDAFLLGVQWHPELAQTQPDWLLQGFVRHCTPGEPH